MPPPTLLVNSMQEQLALLDLLQACLDSRDWLPAPVSVACDRAYCLHRANLAGSIRRHYGVAS